MDQIARLRAKALLLGAELRFHKIKGWDWVIRDEGVEGKLYHQRARDAFAELVQYKEGKKSLAVYSAGLNPSINPRELL